MKKFAIALLALTIASPAVAAHRPRIKTADGFEVHPSHCVYDKLFETWNCWYSPVRPKREQHHHHHHHHYRRDYYRTPVFRPNEYNEHGVPCYFYKKDGWCI